MSVWTRLGMRVDPAEVLAEGRVVRTLEDLPDALPRFKDRDILDAEEVDLAVTALVRAAPEIEEAASGAARVARQSVVGFAEAVAPSGRALLVNELHVLYRNWRTARLWEWQQQLIQWWEAHPDALAPPLFTVSDRAAHAKELGAWAEQLAADARRLGVPEPVPLRLPFDYVTGQRSGRSHALLNMLFGEGYRGRLRGGLRTPRPQPGAMWPRQAHAVYEAASAEALTTLRNLLAAARPGLKAEVDNVILETSIEFSARRAELATDQIRKLVTRYAPNGDLSQLTEEALLELTGKPMTYQEFIHRSLIALDIMADEADTMGPELFEQLLEVPGIESFLAMVLQKSGFEHGYVFEVFLVLRRLFDTSDPARIWMQIVVDGKQGPDIGLILGEGLARTVQLIQAKSYRDINALMRPSATGEIWRQLRSDLLRLAKDGFMVTGPDGTRLPINRSIQFAVDWWHLRTTSFRIDGIDPAELRNLEQGTASTSLAFYDRYIHDKAVAIQELLDSPEFRKELTDLGVPESDTAFTFDVSIVDRIFPDEP